jgi:hypothetical protein
MGSNLEIVLFDMFTILMYAAVLTKPKYQVKFTYLVGSLFIVAISMKYLTNFQNLAVGMQCLAIFLACIQFYFFCKHRNA